MIGLALGSCLHQPVTNNRSIAILGSVALYIGVILLPPITAAHESLSQGRLTPVVVLVLVCCLGLITITKPESTDWLLAGVGGRADAGLGSCGAVGGVLGRVGLGMGGVWGCRRWVCVGASVPGGVV